MDGVGIFILIQYQLYVSFNMYWNLKDCAFYRLSLLDCGFLLHVLPFYA
jgi:hypothetical protein